MSTKRFLMIAGLAESLLHFRGALIAALQERGLEVHVTAPGLASGSAVRAKLEARGLAVHDIPLQRAGRNPLADLRSLWALWLLIRRVQPQYVLAYTIKPVIYGTLAAWGARVPKRFALITGLGYALQGDDDRRALRSLVHRLYGIAVAKAHVVFFQNPDNERLFRQWGLLAARTRSCVVNGSGVELRHFAVQPLPAGGPHFLLIARLLGDKGVREYVQAAQAVRAQHPEVRFAIAGAIDSENPDAIAQEELDAWVTEGSVDYLGWLTDVRSAIAECGVYVLPSYHEGTPRTVLEAMAVGRAIITTDAPGCRETVVDGDNGFLVPVRSTNALIDAMMRFVRDPRLMQSMGGRSRAIAEDKYDVNKVNAIMLHQMGIE